MKKISLFISFCFLFSINQFSYAQDENDLTYGGLVVQSELDKPIVSENLDSFMTSLNSCDGNFYYDKGDYIEAPIFQIQKNSDECVKKIYNAGKYLVITMSNGGDTSAALNIGHFLNTEKEKIVIRKACMSSCFLMVAVSDNGYICDQSTYLGYHKAVIKDERYKDAENDLNNLIKNEIKEKMNRSKIKEFEAFENTSNENLKIINGTTSIDMGFVEGIYCPNN